MKLTRNRLTLRHSMAFVALVALMLCSTAPCRHS